MDSRFSHLVWLGAGTATNPIEQLNAAEKITLIEAREAACLLLQKKCTKPNINIQQQLVSTSTESVYFTEYNLAEYSAIAPATGLKDLFPGLKKIDDEQLTSVAVTDVISELSLAGNNNSLIIDIPDIGLALLVTLQKNGQLSLFKNIQIQTSSEPSYKGAATTSDVVSFLEEAGYTLQRINNQDPELPWLTFAENPLFSTLKKLQQNFTTEQQTKDTIAKELEKVKQDLAAQCHTTVITIKELEQSKQDLAAQQQAKDELNKKLEKIHQTEQTQTKQISKLQVDLEQVSKHAASRAEKIAQLEKANRELHEVNDQLQKRQQTLQQELLKAEAQIDIIKELLLKK